MPPGESTCPGCGLTMPISETAVYDGYYNTTPECWSVYTEVLGEDFGNAVRFGQVHQMTVDAYALQHAGGPHPDKSIAVHLVGLHLVLERGIAPAGLVRHLKRLADVAETWPHFPPPAETADLTVLDAALSEPENHSEIVREWAGQLWRAWSHYHADVADLVSQYLVEL